MKQLHGLCKLIIPGVLIILNASGLKAQENKYRQVCNEFQFTRAFGEKFGTELWIGSTFCSTPEENKAIKTNTQRYGNAWLHYYFSPRWKFSASLAYYYNKDVPDIGQYYSPEWRFSPQACYYLHRIKYTLFTRMRGELRYMMNEEGDFEAKFRYRQALRYVKPLNGNVLRGNVFYFLASEEIFLKPDAQSDGIKILDRNRIDLGVGYLFTDDITFEIAYSNEFLPRDKGDEIYNSLCFTLTFNNLLTNLKNNIPFIQGSKQSD